MARLDATVEEFTYFGTPGGVSATCLTCGRASTWFLHTIPDLARRRRTVLGLLSQLDCDCPGGPHSHAERPAPDWT